jgi:hypothetical protein
METLQRYLHAIEFWLPKAQRKDIIAELSEDLHSQIEEQQDQFGHKMSDAELDALLKQRGNPLLVANRYLPQQSLIGPVLFPLYKFVLKIWALCWLTPAAVLVVLVKHTQHPELPWTSTMSLTIGWLWTAVFVAIGTITLAFVVLERVEAKTHFLENWNPRKLPPVRDPNKISRASSAIEAVFNSAAAVLLVCYTSSLAIWDSSGVRIHLTSVWLYFVWGLAFLSLLNTALSTANFVRPYWSTVRSIIRFAIDTAGTILVCWLLKAHVVRSFWASGLSEAKALDTANTINIWLERSFPYAVVAGLVILGIDLYRVLRVTRDRSPHLNHGTVTVSSL